jgi:hypothetical protein
MVLRGTLCLLQDTEDESLETRRRAKPAHTSALKSTTFSWAVDCNFLVAVGKGDGNESPMHNAEYGRIEVLSVVDRSLGCGAPGFTARLRTVMKLGHRLLFLGVRTPPGKAVANMELFYRTSMSPFASKFHRPREPVVSEK